MIELTVKTLDSQNHQFTVEDDITVEQFKAHIADTVNIPADTQRIIYCGRVLQDSSKLSEYDVHGKVVHLVQRPPPSQMPRSSERSSSPQPQRRMYRPYRMEQGNAMYLGSMAFPGNLMESQGIVPPPPTHSLSGSRLNVARRMLRRAEAVILQLENPSSRQVDQSANEETQEDDEVTPVIEARVIVPNNNEPIDDVLNAVQNTLINATAGAMTMNLEANAVSNTARSSSSTNSASGSAQRSPNQSGTSTPGGPTPRSSSTENLTSDPRSDPNGLPENALRTTEMADLLTLLGQLQARFAPFLANFHNFMQQDPEVPSDQIRSTQLMLNRVSEVMHFLSHAYHSLSDIIVRVRTPPARPLLCRPILIQHSAVVQTGIPIQVEAQINLSADRPVPSASQSQSQSNTISTADGTPTPTDSGATNQPSVTLGGPPTISVQSGFVGVPFLPGTVRVQSIPIEIRNVRASPLAAAVAAAAANTPHPSNNNNNMVNAFFNDSSPAIQLQGHQISPPQQPIGPPSQSGTPTTHPSAMMFGPAFAQIGIVPPRTVSATPTAAATATQPSAMTPTQEGGANGGQTPQQQQTQPPSSATPGSGGAPYGFNNPNVEFFMEVTPEGITIDSLETTLVGSNQANDFLRNAMNGPTPEFLQSIMRMAGQIINQNIATTSAPPQSTATTITSDASSDQPSSQAANGQASSSSAAALAAASGQNSQARVNTQTNPTTATSTRSTPRPHVHLAHQAMQGGFDPFLPCNSHHISRRRAQTSSTNVQRSSQQNSNSTQQQSSLRQSQSQLQQQPRQPQVSLAGVAVSRGGNDQIPIVMSPELGTLLETLTRRLGRPGEQPNDGGEGSQGSASMAGDSGRTDRQQMMPTQLLQFFSRLSTAGNMPDVLSGRSLTLEQLLQQFHQDDQYVPGESIFTDLIMLFVRNLTLVDLFTLNSGNTEPINRNINEIQNFFRTRICDGNISPAGIERGTERLITELQPFLENFSSLPARDDINMVRSAEQLFRTRLPNIINTAVNLGPDSVRSLFDQCVTTAKQLLALTLYVSVTGQTGVEQIYEQLMNRFMQDVSPELHSWTLRTSRYQLRQVLSNLNIPENELQTYIVLTTDPILQSRPNIVASEYIPAPEEAMELDSVESQLTVLDVQQPAVMLEDPEPLPNVILGSEQWHGQVPEDWVPIITRDAQKQRRQNSQGPFSDAYLSGMPSKRRKIVNSSKPQGSLPQVISDSVRQAVTATGLTSVAPLETVAQAAGSSPEIQTAYRNLLRTTVQSNLRNNEDYLPERFPNISNYFNGNHQPQ